MRIWDIDPGYLNRQSLLGEHRELHGMVSVIVNHKAGYSRHPETLRWIPYGWALSRRHRQLAEEMALRGYVDRSPVSLNDNADRWPNTYIDLPLQQYALLRGKYRNKEPGRIALPTTAQELWRQHKYSVLARDTNRYQAIGGQVSRMKPGDDFSGLATTLAECLRVAPSEGGIRNALQHMWGYVSDLPDSGREAIAHGASKVLLQEIQTRAMTHRVPYLLGSTALGELMAWV